MGAAYFYHLTERPLESTLPVLLTKSLAAGWRVAVRGQSREYLTELDRRLWLGEGFLPHGMSPEAVGNALRGMFDDVCHSPNSVEEFPELLLGGGQLSVQRKQQRNQVALCHAYCAY